MEGLTEKLAVHAICDTPVCFSIREYRNFSIRELFRKKEFNIGSISLGKFLRMELLAHEAGIDLLHLQQNKRLRIQIIKAKDKIGGILAIASLHGKKEVNDSAEYKRRSSLFTRYLTTDNMIDLLLSISCMVDVGRFNDYFGITEELKKKKESSSRHDYATWGGKTLWGGLIDAVATRYRWTYDYIVWEISYQNLTMLLSDAIGIDYGRTSASDQEGKYTINRKGKKEIKFKGFGQFLEWVRSAKGEN